jgi:hypothetical protein
VRSSATPRQSAAAFAITLMTVKIAAVVEGRRQAEFASPTASQDSSSLPVGGYENFRVTRIRHL